MHLDDIRGLAVIDREAACVLGTVTDYWIDTNANRIAALGIRGVDIDQPQRVAASRVGRLGRDAVMLTNPGAPQSQATFTGPVPAGWLRRSQLSQLIVYTDIGERLGRVSGARVNSTTLAIEAYELHTPAWRRWFARPTAIVADRVVWCGPDVLVVRTAEAAKLRPVGLEARGGEGLAA